MVFVVFFVADIIHSTFLIPNGLKVNLYSIRFSSDFVRFLRFCLSVNKNVLFHSLFYLFISVLTKPSHTGQKLFDKHFLQRVQPYFEILLLSFIHEIFERNLY